MCFFFPKCQMFAVIILRRKNLTSRTMRYWGFCWSGFIKTTDVTRLAFTQCAIVFASRKCRWNGNLSKLHFASDTVWKKLLPESKFMIFPVLFNRTITLKSFMMKICAHCWYLHSHPVICDKINEKENQTADTSEVHKEIKLCLLALQHFHGEKLT